MKKKTKEKVVTHIEDSVSKGETFIGKTASIDEYSEVTGETARWEVQEVETKADKPLADDGTGTPIILRCFEFKWAPDLKGVPSESQILTEEYKRKLRDRLWIDELEFIQDLKVVFEKGGCKIFATCQAKKGSLIFRDGQLARPDLIQNIVH